VCSVFSDRLVDDKDMEAFVTILTEKLGLLFDQTFHNICPGKQPPIFGEDCNELFLSFFSVLGPVASRSVEGNLELPNSLIKITLQNLC